MGGFEGGVYVSVDQYLSIHRPFICRSIGRLFVDPSAVPGARIERLKGARLLPRWR
jgi:hypothetical protein